LNIISSIKKIFSGSSKCCTNNDLLAGVRHAYSSAANAPQGTHPFPVGKAFAENVGYSRLLLESLPVEASDSFAGVSNVGVFAEIARGSVVLDIGCGAGLDSLIAADKTGRDGRVIGLDFSMAMLGKAITASRRAGTQALHYCCADAASLPIATGSIDIALVNGLFNLNPHRSLLFQEMARVLRPGGMVYAAELIFTRPQVAKKVRTLNDWFS
jgi:SAM-dependent methyltransferase